MTIQALLGALIGPLLTTGITPAKTALTEGVANPGAAIGTINQLLGAEVTNLPALEGEAISAACQLGLDAIAQFEAAIAKLGAPAVAADAVVASTQLPPA